MVYTGKICDDVNLTDEADFFFFFNCQVSFKISFIKINVAIFFLSTGKFLINIAIVLKTNTTDAKLK